MYRIRQQELLDKLRKKCLQKSCGSIKQLGCAFRRMDVDFSKKICFEELREGVRMYGIDMSEEELHVLFNTFDKDRDKLIDFHEFLMALRPPMCNARVRVVNEAFDKLDADGDGVLKVDDLKGAQKGCEMSSCRMLE